MTALIVLGSLLALLAIACVWESRSGKPAWGSHLREDAPTPGDAARTGKKAVGSSVALGVLMGIDGGDG